MRSLKINRVFVLLAFNVFFAVAILGQLVRLQIINQHYYTAKAEEGHLGYTEVHARRGEILIKDHHSQEIFRLATNTSFPLLFADPTLTKDPSYLTDKLAPLLFDKKEAEEKDRHRIRLAKRSLPANPTQEELSRIAPRTEEEMRAEFRSALFEKLSQKTRQSIILYKSPSNEIIKFLEKERMAGIEVSPEAVIAHPPQIGDPDYAAKILAPIVDIPYERLSELLVGRNRYVALRQKIPPELEQQIRQLIKEDREAKRDLFAGISFQEKNYRYYPEGPLAAQVIGFLSDTGVGLYGIEKSFDSQLRGEKGIFKTRLDATGQQVIVGDDLIIQPAVDGDSILLTLDRFIQMEVERLLAKTVQDTKADSGLVVIMEPKTGRIISLAHYPTFDPNEFGKALETEDIALTDEQIKNILTVGDPGEETHYLYIDRDSNYRIQVFKDLLENGKTAISKFKNIIGSAAYRNRVVSDIFEPGSVFKAIAMAIALDDGDVTPTTTFNDHGPIKVDEFEIHNATDTYGGITTMREVLERSLNTGMAFVSRKMGRELFGRYLKKFGFGERTYIEFEDEADAKFKDSSRWAESELVTYAFGQGIAVTPIQLVTAVSVLANKGVLMKPHIVDSEPEQVRRVISEKTAATISAMMVSVVESSATRRAVVPGYKVAGKTGTAQTYKHGKPLTGPGTTIGSFIGFGPIEDPRFVILVKIDRPRSSIWSDATATPLFAEIAKFLFKYYNIPPEA